MTAPSLVGRDPELQALTEVIDLAVSGGPCVVVPGDPGIGKSALLRAARDIARAEGYRVLMAAGVESEAQLPFAGLHQIIRPVLPSVSALRPVHRQALHAAFGLADGERPE